jgi:membrane-associated protein
VNEALIWVNETIDALPIWAIPLFAGLAIMLETSIFIGLIVPGDTVVLVASTTVTSPVDFAALLTAVLIGSLIGETIGFGIGHFFGPKIRASRLGQKIGEANWIKAERLVARRGGIAVFISRFLPVLHSVVPAVAGATKMRYRIFIAYTFAACLIWSSLYVGVGSAARASFDRLSEDLRIATAVGLGILLIFVLVIAVSKKVLDRITRHDDKADAQAAAEQQNSNGEDDPASTETEAPTRVSGTKDD